MPIIADKNKKGGKKCWWHLLDKDSNRKKDGPDREKDSSLSNKMRSWGI